MKITAFNKAVEIDEKNKGIDFYFNNIGETINEITIVFWYRRRKKISTEQAAEELRNMSADELSAVVHQNFRDAILAYQFDEEYANYV